MLCYVYFYLIYLFFYLFIYLFFVFPRWQEALFKSCIFSLNLYLNIYTDEFAVLEETYKLRKPNTWGAKCPQWKALLYPLGI